MSHQHALFTSVRPVEQDPYSASWEACWQGVAVVRIFAYFEAYPKIKYINGNQYSAIETLNVYGEDIQEIIALNREQILAFIRKHNG